jgi:hypothetical protein
MGTNRDHFGSPHWFGGWTPTTTLCQPICRSNDDLANSLNRPTGNDDWRHGSKVRQVDADLPCGVLFSNFIDDGTGRSGDSFQSRGSPWRSRFSKRDECGFIYFGGFHSSCRFREDAADVHWKGDRDHAVDHAIFAPSRHRAFWRHVFHDDALELDVGNCPSASLTTTYQAGRAAPVVEDTGPSEDGRGSVALAPGKGDAATILTSPPMRGEGVFQEHVTQAKGSGD